MNVKTFEIDSLNEDLTAKFYPLLSDTKKELIASMPTPYERSVAFCSEILARQCLHELFHSPEFSFKLLLVPDGKSVVGNFDAKISLSLSGNFLGCAVSKKNVGISVKNVEDYSFSDLQSLLTDKELRDVFSFSKYSFTELMQQKVITEENVKIRAASFLTMKQAYFRAKGKLLNCNMLGVEFFFEQDNAVCSDKTVSICKIGYNKKNNAVFAVAEENG